jgi:hypothetical protein
MIDAWETVRNARTLAILKPAYQSATDKAVAFH